MKDNIRTSPVHPACFTAWQTDTVISDPDHGWECHESRQGKAAEQQERKKGVGQKTPAEPPTYISHAFASTE
jgi:hypothetical protein